MYRVLRTNDDDQLEHCTASTMMSPRYIYRVFIGSMDEDLMVAVLKFIFVKSSLELTKKPKLGVN